MLSESLKAWHDLCQPVVPKASFSRDVFITKYHSLNADYKDVLAKSHKCGGKRRFRRSVRGKIHLKGAYPVSIDDIIETKNGFTVSMTLNYESAIKNGR